jgi:hypothetical protein
MNAEKEIRRTNAWLQRRVRASQIPIDAEPYINYQHQSPQRWRNVLVKLSVVAVILFAVGLVTCGLITLNLWLAK